MGELKLLTLSLYKSFTITNKALEEFQTNTEKVSTFLFFFTIKVGRFILKTKNRIKILIYVKILTIFFGSSALENYGMRLL